LITTVPARLRLIVAASGEQEVKVFWRNGNIAVRPETFRLFDCGSLRSLGRAIILSLTVRGGTSVSVRRVLSRTRHLLAWMALLASLPTIR
jgi:hypothetical protein